MTRIARCLMHILMMFFTLTHECFKRHESVPFLSELTCLIISSYMYIGVRYRCYKLKSLRVIKDNL